MTTWMIEGERAGKIVHRHYTMDRNEVYRCRDLGSILLTDGTRLVFRSPMVLDDHRKPEIHEHLGLIRECIRHGVRAQEEIA